MHNYKKEAKISILELINRSRPRPEVRLRSTVFKDRTKYERSREKQFLRKELSL